MSQPSVRQEAISTCPTSTAAPWRWLQSIEGGVFENMVASSIYMSASMASLTFLTQLVLFQEPIQSGSSTTNHNLPLTDLDCGAFFLVFFECMVVYTTDHLRDAKHKHSEGTSYNTTRLRTLQRLGMLGLVVALGMRRSIQGSLLIVVHLSLGMLYAKPMPTSCCFWSQPTKTRRGSFGSRTIHTPVQFRLKDIPYFKSVFVAFCVTFMVVACPLVLRSSNYNHIIRSVKPLRLLQLCTTIFTIQLSIENIQDMRDVHEDWKRGTKTLPVGMGIRRTKRFVTNVTKVSFAMCFLPVIYEWYEGPHVSLVTINALLIPLVLRIGKHIPRPWFSYVEGVSAVPLLVYWILPAELSAFLAPPNESNPFPWHIWLVGFCWFSTYFVHRNYETCPTADRDDLLPSGGTLTSAAGRPEGLLALTIMYMTKNFALLAMAWILWSHREPLAPSEFAMTTTILRCLWIASLCLCGHEAVTTTTMLVREWGVEMATVAEPKGKAGWRKGPGRQRRNSF